LEQTMPLTHRLATRDDLPVLLPLIDAAIDELQTEYLTDAQIRASRAVMGVDTQLIDDGTYFVVEIDGQVAGCGGWGRRATMYGGDHSGGRDAAMLDPTRDPARVRAMYTHPDFTRRGVGRLILSLCEEAAAAAGFSTVELVATESGFPLYSSFGFETTERFDIVVDDVPVPATRMIKSIAGESGQVANASANVR
jgi:GNAT superfamily N-acetyltransferase